ncbi:MAG: glycosyltransferase [candidate division WOR-3 bacterium]
MKKKLLFLTDMIPSKSISGARIRNYFILQKLSKIFEVYLFCIKRKQSVEESLEEQLLEDLRNYTREIYIYRFKRNLFIFLIKFLKSLILGKSYFIERLFFKDFHKKIKEFVKREKIDVLYLAQLNLINYGRGIKIKKVLDNHNVHFKLTDRIKNTLSFLDFKKYFFKIESFKLKKIESKLSENFELVLCVSEFDRNLLLKLNKNKEKIKSLPIFLNSGTIKYIEKPKKSNLLCLGDLKWLPNKHGVLWFLKNVYPLLEKENLDFNLNIVGDGSLGIKIKDKRINFLGFRKDIDEVWRNSYILIVPLFSGSGVRVKIIEAFARGIPVVSTSIGCEGLKVKDGENIMIANEPLDFRNKIVFLLKDEKIYENIRQNAFLTFKKYYSETSYEEKILDYFKYFL